MAGIGRIIGNKYYKMDSEGLDGKELPVEQLINKGVEVCQKYIHSVNEISEEVVGIIKLPENWKKTCSF